MTSILFVCIHNACRSQIAEAICRKMAPDSWVVASAGSRPSSAVDSKAAMVLKEYGLAMNHPKPKGFSDLPTMKWDYVVGMGCGDVCPYVAAKKVIDWNIPDPLDGPMTLYRTLYEDLSNRIETLVRDIK